MYKDIVATQVRKEEPYPRPFPALPNQTMRCTCMVSQVSAHVEMTWQMPQEGLGKPREAQGGPVESPGGPGEGPGRLRNTREARLKSPEEFAKGLRFVLTALTAFKGL